MSGKTSKDIPKNDSPKQQKRPLPGKSSKKNDEPNPWGENYSCNKRDIANNQLVAEETNLDPKYDAFEAEMDGVITVKRISAKLTSEAKQSKENSPKTKQPIQNTERSPKPVRSSNKPEVKTTTRLQDRLLHQQLDVVSVFSVKPKYVTKYLTDSGTNVRRVRFIVKEGNSNVEMTDLCNTMNKICDIGMASPYQDADYDALLDGTILLFEGQTYGFGEILGYLEQANIAPVNQQPVPKTPTEEEKDRNSEKKDRSPKPLDRMETKARVREKSPDKKRADKVAENVVEKVVKRKERSENTTSNSATSQQQPKNPIPTVRSKKPGLPYPTPSNSVSSNKEPATKKPKLPETTPDGQDRVPSNASSTITNSTSVDSLSAATITNSTTYTASTPFQTLVPVNNNLNNQANAQTDTPVKAIEICKEVFTLFNKYMDRGGNMLRDAELLAEEIGITLEEYDYICGNYRTLEKRFGTKVNFDKQFNTAHFTWSDREDFWNLMASTTSKALNVPLSTSIKAYELLGKIVGHLYKD